jgi:hypothetical protein
MNWIMVVLVGLAAMSLFRIVSQFRRVSKPRDDDWDARFIAQLRKAGVSPFDAHPVDFFFDLPDETACKAIAEQLEPEGFVVDYRKEDDGERFSLHASATMRLVVDEMSERTKRFRALVEGHGGRYDGWAVSGGPKRATIRKI